MKRHLTGHGYGCLADIYFKKLRILLYVPEERPFMHHTVCCKFLISSGWGGGGEGGESEGEKPGG
jgi:hypothetical protein